MKRDPMETAAALLASSPIFQGAIPQELQAFLLRGGVPLHAFQRGETLCLPGADNDRLGTLVEGSAQVSEGGSIRPALNEQHYSKATCLEPLPFMDRAIISSRG